MEDKDQAQSIFGYEVYVPLFEDDDCDCGHEHHHHHDGECDCGHEHHHHDGECDCDCGDDCTCGKHMDNAFAEYDFACDGVTQHIRRWGKPGKNPILLLHGFMQTGDGWWVIAPTLTREFTVYAVDLLGHGQTSAPDDPACYTLANQADLLAKVITDVIQPEAAEVNEAAAARPVRPHVLGYSMGGRIAQELAFRHMGSVCSLVLEASGLGPQDQDEREALAERAAGQAAQLRDEGMEAFVDRWEQLPLFESQLRMRQSFKDAVRAERLSQNPEAMAKVLEGMGQHTMREFKHTLDSLYAMWVPGLYICGNKDQKYMDLMHPFVHIDWETKSVFAGHNAHAENPDYFLDAVMPFFRSNQIRI